MTDIGLIADVRDGDRLLLDVKACCKLNPGSAGTSVTSEFILAVRTACDLNHAPGPRKYSESEAV
jgi:hypothetical protein